MTSHQMHIAFRILLDRIDAKVYANIQDEEINYFLNKAQERLVKQRFSGRNPARESFEETQKRIDDLKNIVSPNITLVQSAVQTGVKEGGVYFDLPADYWFAIQEEADIIYTDCADSETGGYLSFFPITHNEYNIISDDPFNKPQKLSHGLRLMSNGKLEALTNNDFEIANYYLRYVIKPSKIIFKSPVTGGIPSGRLVAGEEYIVEGTLGSAIVHNGITYSLGDGFIAVNSSFTVSSGSPQVQLLNKNCELSDEIHDEIVDEAVNLALEVIESPRFQTQSMKNFDKE